MGIVFTISNDSDYSFLQLYEPVCIKAPQKKLLLKYGAISELYMILRLYLERPYFQCSRYFNCNFINIPIPVQRFVNCNS